MILTLDIGNSFVKAGVFVEDQLTVLRRYAHADLPDAMLKDAQNGDFGDKVQYIGLVSVGKKEMKDSLQRMQEIFPQAAWVDIDRDSSLPVSMAYRSPETLGMDRVCSAVGARELCGKGPLLCIDAGTAITYDYIDRADRYLGGGISPGIRTRFRALNHFTASLPLVKLEGRLPLVGDNTETSIRSGVVNGVLAELSGIAERYRELAGDDLKVAITGGDADFLGNHLKNINFVDSNLLLRGILAIVLHQTHHA